MVAQVMVVTIVIIHVIKTIECFYTIKWNGTFYLCVFPLTLTNDFKREK